MEAHKTFYRYCVCRLCLKNGIFCWTCLEIAPLFICLLAILFARVSEKAIFNNLNASAIHYVLDRMPVKRNLLFVAWQLKMATNMLSATFPFRSSVRLMIAPGRPWRTLRIHLLVYYCGTSYAARLKWITILPQRAFLLRGRSRWSPTCCLQRFRFEALCA